MKKLMLIVCLLMSFSLMAENTLIKMQTSEGDIFLKLYDDKAPQSVANFLQYVNDDFYDGTESTGGEGEEGAEFKGVITL